MNAKRIVSLVLAAVLMLGVLALTSCGEDDTAKKYKIGISQLVTHDALDAATNGFMDAVKKGLGEENVEFDLQNAGNSTDVCATIANSFVSQKVDLIMANATPALQAAANATLTIPVLGTSITEYGVALGINNFNGTVGGNISGTSDLAPLDQQAQMILDLVPGVQKVGLLYCSGEANSDYQVKAHIDGDLIDGHVPRHVDGLGAAVELDLDVLVAGADGLFVHQGGLMPVRLIEVDINIFVVGILGSLGADLLPGAGGAGRGRGSTPRRCCRDGCACR